MTAPLSSRELEPIRPMKAEDVITQALTWVGTPYKWQGRSKVLGVDCLGFLAGLFGEIYGFIPWQDRVPNYSPSWADNFRVPPDAPYEQREPFLHAANHWLEPVADKVPLPGDVIIFRIRRESAAKHAAVMNYGKEIIHGFDGHEVMSSAPSSAWFKPERMYIYSWPGIPRWQR